MGTFKTMSPINLILNLAYKRDLTGLIVIKLLINMSHSSSDPEVVSYVFDKP